jgi:hypothetical protein
MKRLKIGPLQRRLSAAWQTVSQHRIFRDKLSLIMIGLALAANVLFSIYLAGVIKPVNFPIPIRFSSLTGFGALGQWYDLYWLTLFAWVTFFVNVLLALYCFGRSRITSFFLITNAIVIALFSGVISVALARVIG